MYRNIWAIILPILATLLWAISLRIKPAFPTLEGRSIALLIAHPDDEAMFFAPTVLSLSRPELNNKIRIICLSTGNSSGIGYIRREELVDSAKLLGIPVQKDRTLVTVIDDDRFPDSIETEWSSSHIQELLMSLVDDSDNLLFDTLITFDKEGISNHPNHRSLYHGAVALTNFLKGTGNYIPLYTLPTRNIVRKYSGVFDVFLTIALQGRRATTEAWHEAFSIAPLPLSHTHKHAHDQPSVPPIVISISGPHEYRQARDAMVKAHKSQMQWFRWGWISLSRYMFINELQLEQSR